jgi:hypothetical protein
MLREHWVAKKADQAVFIMAVILNPFIQLDAFNSRSALHFFPTLWSYFWALYVRINNLSSDGAHSVPRLQFRRTFQQYIDREGFFSDTTMDLEERRRASELHVSEYTRFLYITDNAKLGRTY